MVELKFVTLEECEREFPIGCVVHQCGDNCRAVDGYIFDGAAWSPAEDTWDGWCIYEDDDLNVKRTPREGTAGVKFDKELAQKYPIGTILIDERHPEEFELTYYSAADLVAYQLRGYVSIRPITSNKCIATKTVGSCYKVNGYIYRMSDNTWYPAYDDGAWVEFRQLENGEWRLNL